MEKRAVKIADDFDFDWVLLCFESALSGCFSHLTILRGPDTFSWSPTTPLRMHLSVEICGGSAGYAPGSDVYSSQGHQTGIGQPGEGPRLSGRRAQAADLSRNQRTYTFKELNSP